MDWRSFSDHRQDRGPEFYLTALRYGNSLWQRGFAARSILCLDRALGADLQETDAVLREQPLPYLAMAWILAATPGGVFMGNPRVHFQHYADRLREPRRDQRKWRAWACWELARVVLPHLPGDPRHNVDEPARETIAANLRRFGHSDEAAQWAAALAYAATLKARSRPDATP